MYESPIKVVQGEMKTQLEGEILKAVHRVGITVDRDELIRALCYDREQYQKGFDDARKGTVVVTRYEDCTYRIYKYMGEEIGEVGGCTLFNYAMPNDGFCSYGERKEQPCCTDDGCPIVYTAVPAPGETDKRGGDSDADV